jgi:hypothetical protein
MSSHSRRPGRFADRSIIAVFLAGVGLPLLGTVLRLDLMPAGNDMRQLAPFPRLACSVQAIRSFPEAFEVYYRDHFGLRGPLIRALSLAKVRLLGVSNAAQVVLGKDGWLYHSHLPPGQNHDEVRPFTPAELDRWTRVLQRRHDWLAARGCRYVLLIPPDKQAIYPEHVHEYARPRHASGRLGPLLDYLKAHSQVKVLDVRDRLRQARQRADVYYATDSHWNARGAFLGYEAVAHTLADWFPTVRPLTLADFDESIHPDGGGDLAGLLDLRVYYHEPRGELVSREQLRARVSDEAIDVPRGVTFHFAPPAVLACPDSTLPRAVVFYDSFGQGFLHLLAEHFQRTVVLWHDDFLPEVVLREQPDVVIQEMVERKLGYVVPNDLDRPD